MALDPKEYSAVQKVRAGKVYPDLVNSLALRNLPKETAEVEGWPTYYMPSACANGHTAARFVKNDLCIDCWRVRQGRETIYPTAKNRTYYKQREPAAVPANGAPVTIAPAAPSQPELSKPKQKFLAELAEARDIDTACTNVPGFTRGTLESALSTDPAFKTAFQDLTDRLGIATRAPDEKRVEWTPQFEKAFGRRLVDCGLVEQTRTEMGVSASEYHDRLQKSPAFAALISASDSLARITLRERAEQAAATGNDRLLKIIGIEKPDELSNLSVEEMNAEITKLLQKFKAMGLFPTERRHKVTGEIIDLDDFEYLQPDRSNNADLVS